MNKEIYESQRAAIHTRRSGSLSNQADTPRTKPRRANWARLALMVSFFKSVGGGHGSGAADPRPDPRVAAVSLAVPLGAFFSAESLARIAIPVGLTTAGNDLVLVPRFHSERVLELCKTCRRLSSHPSAGHFDWLSPWPVAVAQTVAATQMRGGLPNAQFTPAERQKAFDAIAAFFAQTL